MWGHIPVFVAALASLVIGPLAVMEACCAAGSSYTVSKVSRPQPGIHVVPGDVVRYTVTITHTGDESVADASYTDDVSDDLDGARWNDDLEVSSGVTAFNGGVLAWAGDLEVGDVVTVTYSVTVTDAYVGEGV
ncbi:hypothetical protein [Phytoactinopolyspora endophytica]|uniref:DUF7927 domain-containing protein n=1 Tax=Phytoactinopolyspora endophytica TaxID=1642495 RepID=UPI00197B6AD1|nr:hypothetical protein [Phytoactinopolyspora endophytica]